MKNMKWFGALLLAGSMLAGGVAQAGPAMGPYGPWNSGGAFGGFGPYATSGWYGCRMPDRVLTTLAIKPEIVGERIVKMPGKLHKKHHHKIIIGERKVYQEMRRPLFASSCTPTRLKLLGIQRFTAPQTVIETLPVKRSTAVFVPAREEIVAEKVVEKQYLAPSTSCDLVNPYF